MEKYLLPLLLILLVACSTATDSTKPIETSKATDVESKFDKKSDATITEQEALSIAKEVIEQLQTAPYPEQVGDYILDHNNYVFNEGEIEEIIALKNELVREFATQSFIDSNIPLDEFNCVENCDIIIPNDLHYAWKPRVENLSDSSFQVIAFVLDYDLDLKDFNSFEQTIDFVLEDELWKINGLSREQKDMNLQVEEIEPYMTARGFPNIQVNSTDETYEYNGKDELVYNVTDLDHGDVFILFARTGNYLYTTEHGEVFAPGEGDYSIDNEEDYLNYMLFDYYRNAVPLINTNNPTYRDYVYELDNLSGAILAPMDTGDIDSLENYLAEAKAKYDEIYSDLSRSWSTNEQQYFDTSYETFLEQLNTYLSEYLPTNTDDVTRIGKETSAIINYSYILLSEQSN